MLFDRSLRKVDPRLDVLCRSLDKPLPPSFPRGRSYCAFLVKASLSYAGGFHFFHLGTWERGIYRHESLGDRPFLLCPCRLADAPKVRTLRAILRHTGSLQLPR